MKNTVDTVDYFRAKVFYLGVKRMLGREMVCRLFVE